MARLLIAVIRIYQLTIAGWLGSCCRFYPHCSAYWIEALREHGFFRGMGLGLRRLSRCHPWHPGGVDLVPAARR